jgi:hypothetical protein
MGSDIGADSETDDQMASASHLSRISSRTSMMTIDAVLNAVPRNGAGYASAAAELRAIARRMVHTTRDFAAAQASGIRDQAPGADSGR